MTTLMELTIDLDELHSPDSPIQDVNWVGGDGDAARLCLMINDADVSVMLVGSVRTLRRFASDIVEACDAAGAAQ